MAESEYGHSGTHWNGVFMDTWGAGPYVLKYRSRTFYFEDSKRFGPARLDAKGEVAGMFPQRSPFWTHWRRWVDAGRPTETGEKNGWLYCVVPDDEVPR